jgi:hypothetical protein
MIGRWNVEMLGTQAPLCACFLDAVWSCDRETLRTTKSVSAMSHPRFKEFRTGPLRSLQTLLTLLDPHLFLVARLSSLWPKTLLGPVFTWLFGSRRSGKCKEKRRVELAGVLALGCCYATTNLKALLFLFGVDCKVSNIRGLLLEGICIR